MATPTKPLLTARFTLVNTSPYSVNQILTIFRGELEKLGLRIYQTPAIRSYLAKYTTSKEGPFDGDDSKSIFETMLIAGPAGKPLSIAKDLTNDAKGSRPILEQRKPYVTAITWNIGGSDSQKLSDALWSIRKSRVMDQAHYVGLGWTPVVTTWNLAPKHLTPYPDRPPIPAALLPSPKPAPIKPAPIKPAPEPPPPPPAPAPIIYHEAKPWFQPWMLLVGFMAMFAITQKGTTRSVAK